MRALHTMCLALPMIMAALPGAAEPIFEHTRLFENCKLESGQNVYYRIPAITVAKDGSILAVGHRGGQIGIWNTSNWAATHWLEEHKQLWLRALDFSPDQRTLISGGIDGTIRFWHVATGTQVGQLSQDPSIHVIGLSFSPDGRSLYVATEADPLIARWPIPQ